MKFTFTKLDNSFFKLLPYLSEAATKIMLVIARYTDGYHKSFARISYSTYIKATGLDRDTIALTLADLKEKGLIYCSPKYEYNIDWNAVEELINQSEKTTGKVSKIGRKKRLPPVGKNDQKETNLVVKDDLYKEKDLKKDLNKKEFVKKFLSLSKEAQDNYIEKLATREQSQWIIEIRFNEK